MNVTVFGVGYVGLVQAAVLADVGHHVCCVDVDEKKIENLENGIIPIFEPGLSELVLKNHEKQRLIFTTDAKKEAVRDGATPLELVDGEKLVEMFEELSLGVRPKTDYELVEEFFDQYR